MARPRIFVSSTYYDLRHVRSSVESFIDSLGFEAILSEKGEIAYHPDRPLDESCYREAAFADIFVMIIGGRYGSEAGVVKPHNDPDFYDQYDSITSMEYAAALKADIPSYILIESSVYSEYHTFLKNTDHKSIIYAHVDSVNIFSLIKMILAQPRNNPVFPFDRASQIEEWLKEQWSGLFKDLLRSRVNEKQFVALSDQIREMKAANDTMKKYLEAILETANPSDARRIAEEEFHEREQTLRREAIRQNGMYKLIQELTANPNSDIADTESRANSIIKSAESLEDLIKRADAISLRRMKTAWSLSHRLSNDPQAMAELNKLRELFELPPLHS